MEVAGTKAFIKTFILYCKNLLKSSPTNLLNSYDSPKIHLNEVVFDTILVVGDGPVGAVL